MHIYSGWNLLRLNMGWRSVQSDIVLSGNAIIFLWHGFHSQTVSGIWLDREWQLQRGKCTRHTTPTKACGLATMNEQTLLTLNTSITKWATIFHTQSMLNHNAPPKSLTAQWGWKRKELYDNLCCPHMLKKNMKDAHKNFLPVTEQAKFWLEYHDT